jgi:hypothetical protein
MKRYLLIAILITIFLAPIIWLFLNLSFSEKFDCEVAKNTIPLVGKTINQSFIPSHDGLSSINIKLVTYAQLASGKIFFEIIDNSQNVLFSKKVYALTLKDNSFYNLKIPSDLLKAGNEYSLKISSSISSKRPAGLTRTSSDCYTGNLQKDNENIKDADIVLHLKYSEEKLSLNIERLVSAISLFKSLLFKGWGLIVVSLLYVSLVILTVTVFFRKVF